MKRKISSFLGVLFIAIGLVVIFVVLYLRISSQSKSDVLISNSVIYEKQSDEIVCDENDEDTLVIEELDSDQEVAEIKTGTPVISIPSLDITVPVLDGTDKVTLRYGAGKFEKSADMGKKGNFCVAGHSSSVYNCIFNDLDKIRTLSEILCYDSSGKCYTYYVTNKFVTEPTDLSVLDGSKDKIMTIVTCAENGTKRFIVTAQMFNSYELKEYKNSLQQGLVDEAFDIASECADIEFSSYFDESNILVIPYNFQFTFKEDVEPCLYNLLSNKNMLKSNEHNYKVDFNQRVGFIWRCYS